MKRIGVIGGECSLAEYFAWFFNEKNDKGEYNVPDYRVTAISGYYKKENLAIADKFNVDKVYDDFTEMAGDVDAVMITARDGKYHYGFAKPFLENKTPLYIFKPVTTDYAQAKELISVAKKNNTLVCGGSFLKYSTHVLETAKTVNENKNSVFGGQIVTPIFTDCEYSGFWFYASHLVEICLTVYGKDIRSLYATENGKNVTVIFDYDGFSVVGQYANDCANSYQTTIILKDRNIVAPVDDGVCIGVGCKKFVEMIETEKMPESYEDMIFPVYIIEKIIESYTLNKRVVI